jgi:two-component sensor histidine kinase
MNAAVTRRVSFELLFETFPGVIAPTRRFVQDTLQPVLQEPDDVSRIAMAAHELLENAVQHATGPVTKLSVALSTGSTLGFREVALRLTNETSPQHVERLRSAVAVLDDPARALEYYRGLMVKKWDQDRESSGMGLARIVVESEMKLAVEVNGSSVTLLASGWIGEARR